MLHQGPFPTTGNGFFASWGGAFTATGYLADASGRSMSTIGASVKRGSGALYALSVPSIVLIIALVKQYCFFGTCSSYLEENKYHDEAAYGVSVGAISLAGILGLVLLDGRSEQADLGHNGAKVAEWAPKLVAFALVCLWAVCCVILTFHEPFTTTSAGYFACWLGFLFSFSFAMQQFPELERAVDKATA